MRAPIAGILWVAPKGDVRREQSIAQASNARGVIRIDSIRLGAIWARHTHINRWSLPVRGQRTNMSVAAHVTACKPKGPRIAESALVCGMSCQRDLNQKY